MILGFGSCRPLARQTSLAALLAVCALAPSSAAAMSDPPGHSALSPRLAELATPAVRTLPPAAQARQLDLVPSGAGSLLRDGNRVLVDVRLAGGVASALDELRGAGAEILASSRRYKTVTVAIAPARLPQLAAVPGVEGVGEKRAPLLSGSGSPATAALGAECEGGAIISEGIEQLLVADARSRYGVDGGGITVGALSDSYDQTSTASDGSGPVATHAVEDIESGDLPGPANSCNSQQAPVDVLEDFSGSEASDEGRAMLQIVHDVAPAAELAFATAFLSEFSFAQNIERLAQPAPEGADADVIVDDVFWLEEPFFQDGPIAVAVDKVAAAGTAYFSAAGNNNLFEGSNEIASWEAPAFRDAETCPLTVLDLLAPGGGHCMDFNPDGGIVDTTFGITVSPGETLTLDLQWAEPWFGIETDLDAYLLNAGGDVIVSEDNDNLSALKQRPVELPQWENASGSSKTVRLVINRCAGECNPAASGTATPTVKFALLQNGGGVTKTEYPTSLEGDTVGPTIVGHAAASGAATVAAVPFSNSQVVESYSSRGPVVHRFGPVEGTTPAPALPTPETIAKPDIAATDCGATTFFAFFSTGEGTWRFCGASAAAPHAAAVAALELEAKPTATVEELRDAQTATAVPVGAFGANAAGAGLLNADAAIASLLPPSAVAITAHPSSRTADSTPSFEFESTPASAFECSIDAGAPQPCTSPFTVPQALPDGPHLFEVEAVDLAEKASFSFTVDTTPPAIDFSKRPAAISPDRNPTVAFSADEPAEFTCSLDGAVTPHCASPFAIKSLADGPHRFVVTAVDQVGNSNSATVDFRVDTVAPSVALTEQPPAKSTNRLPSFAFSANEPVAFACSIDEAPVQPCASPFLAPSPLADGSHGFGVVATDLAGNAATVSAFFAIDTRDPQTFFTARPGKLLRTRQSTVRASFRFGSNETGVNFVCKVDRGLLRFCPTRLSRRFAPGPHTIRVKARDEVGNVDRTPAVFRFRIERTDRD
jgi:Subtilase family